MNEEGIYEKGQEGIYEKGQKVKTKRGSRNNIRKMSSEWWKIAVKKQ